MYYEILFLRRIKVVAGDDIWLGRKMTLPFIPTVGLKVADGSWVCRCDSVLWNHQQKEFYAYQEDNEKPRNAETALFRAKEYYIPNGWGEVALMDEYGKLIEQ